MIEWIEPREIARLRIFRMTFPAVSELGGKGDTEAPLILKRKLLGEWM